MGDGEGEVEKEGRALVLADPREGFLGKEVMGVIDPLGGGSANETAVSFLSKKLNFISQDLLVEISPDEFRVEVVGVNLVEVTVQVVETLTERMAFLANFAQAPLADQGSRVIGLLQGFGYCEVLFSKLCLLISPPAFPRT